MTKKVFVRKNLPLVSLAIVLITYLYTIGYFHPYTKNEDGNRGVIKWDVISYYSYLPATVIHHDLSLEFIGKQKGFRNDNRFWPSTMKNGNRLIVTSMGLSFMYAPFFFIAHALAPLLKQPADGFSNIYQFMLVLGGLFYAFSGLILLMRLLRRYFDPLVTAITMLCIGLGTNLFFYATVEAAMPHGHNFFLVVGFIYLLRRWYADPRWFNALFTGALFGLIVLVRPTNVLFFFILLLYGVKDRKGFGERIRFYLSRWYLVLLMLLAFLLPWIPQMLYWKSITGHFLYFSYAEKNASFFWNAPQILNNLFSFRKGWLIYTPVMWFALAGLPFLRSKCREWFLPLLIYLPLMIYVQSCWWCWWFGGGFGMRPYVSMYPLLAFPLAVFLTRTGERAVPWLYRSVLGMLVVLTAYQVFQTRQFTTQAIHYSAATRASYLENFLKTYPTAASWKMLEVPDFQLARKGVYVAYDTSVDKEVWRNMDPSVAEKRLQEGFEADRAVMRQIGRFSRREGIPPDSAMHVVSARLYERITR